MQGYGTTPTHWSTIDAPNPVTGICEDFTIDPKNKRDDIKDASGEFSGVITSAFKTELSWNYTFNSSSMDFLDLSTGSKLAVTGFTAGGNLAIKAVERWAKGQPKKGSINATNYPDLVTGGSGASAGTLSAVSPAITSYPYQFPTGQYIMGTAVLTHASGSIESMELTQEWTSIEEILLGEKITGVILSAFKRMIQIELLLTGTIPAVGSTLVVSGAPSHASGFIILTPPKSMYKIGKSMMVSFQADWFNGI